MQTKVKMSILNINKLFDVIQRLNLQVVLQIPHGSDYLYYIFCLQHFHIYWPPASHCIAAQALEESWKFVQQTSQQSALYSLASLPLATSPLTLCTAGCTFYFRYIVFHVSIWPPSFQIRPPTSIVHRTFCHSFATPLCLGTLIHTHGQRYEHYAHTMPLITPHAGAQWPGAGPALISLSAHLGLYCRNSHFHRRVSFLGSSASSITCSSNIFDITCTSDIFDSFYTFYLSKIHFQLTSRPQN